MEVCTSDLGWSGSLNLYPCSNHVSCILLRSAHNGIHVASEQILQLDELLAMRHCVFIVGNAGAGKSSCWKVLQEAKSRLYPDQKVKVSYPLYPRVLLR